MSMNNIRWMVAIVDRGKSNKAVFILHEHHLETPLAVRGYGTASSAITDCLGLDGLEKDLVLGIATGVDAHQAVEVLKHRMEFDKSGHEITFSIPFSGISVVASNSLEDWDTSQTQIIAYARENTSMSDSRYYELVVTIINTDLSALAMEAARKADCHGGTLVKAGEVGADGGKKLFGLAFSQEKVVLLILIPVFGKQPILEAIRETILQETGEHTVAFSMPANEVQGISGQNLANRPGG